MADYTRVLLVEDQALVRDGMVALIEAAEGIEVVATAASMAEAATALETTIVDVIVVDFVLEDESGADVVELASRLQPHARTMVITGANEMLAIDAAIRAGCAGFLSKGKGSRELVSAVRAIAGGAAVFPVELLANASRRVANRPGNDLTSREANVLELLAKARTTTEIANELSLSQHTVRNHLRQVLTKLQARNQLEAVVIAIREGLVTIDVE